MIYILKKQQIKPKSVNNSAISYNNIKKINNLIQA
jgi:hypothetical protein